MLELMRNRRSIRKFQNRPVEAEKLDKILECALRSPSSMGKQPWKIWTVTDKEILKTMSVAKLPGTDFITKASAAFIVGGYPEVADAWIEDCSIVSIVIQLEAESLGLGSCWWQIRNRPHDNSTSASDYLKTSLGLDGECEILCVIAVGYKDEEKQGHTKVPFSKSEKI